MNDNLENKIGIALKSTQFQMMHSDAKEGLTYMHEQVEELRELNNPWDNPFDYYKRHLEIASFLKHLGFTEFDEEQLRLIYNEVVNAVYHPKVRYDPQPETQVTAHKAEENFLQKQLENAKTWSDYLSKNNPTKYPVNILNLCNGVYITNKGEDSVVILRLINKKMAIILENEKFLNEVIKKKQNEKNYMFSCALNGLNKYETLEPTILNNLFMIFEPWFKSSIFDIEDLVYAFTGCLVLLRKKVEEKYTAYNPDYLKERDLWNEIYLNSNSKYLSSLCYIEGLEFLRFEGYKRKGKEFAIKKTDVDTLSSLLQRVKGLLPDAEKAFNNYAGQIQKQYPVLVKKWSDEEKRISSKLQKLSKDREIWTDQWRENYSGVKECGERKQEALNDPWMNKTHSLFNTSAYSAKLVGLSAQLEALQSGISLSQNRLLTG